eukprot:5892-Chlamydomonas_euryale.AAC.1
MHWYVAMTVCSKHTAVQLPLFLGNHKCSLACMHTAHPCICPRMHAYCPPVCGHRAACVDAWHGCVNT